MRGYEQLRRDAIHDAMNTLAERHDGLDASAVGDLLDDTTLPGFLALLGRGIAPRGSDASVEDKFLGTVAEAAAKSPEVEKLGLDADDVEHLLRGFLTARREPTQVLGDERVRQVLWKASLAALERETGIKLDEAERKQIVALLTSGQFFDDAAHSTAAVLRAVPGLPVALLRDAQSSPFRVAQLTLAVARDLRTVPGSVHHVMADLLGDGKIDRPPAVLVNTLAELFRFSGVDTARETVAELIRPDNRSVRLAIVIYARSQGIPLKESDLDLVNRHLLSGSPDLGPLLVAAAERMMEERGGDHVMKVLGRLGTPRHA